MNCDTLLWNFHCQHISANFISLRSCSIFLSSFIAHIVELIDFGIILKAGFLNQRMLPGNKTVILSYFKKASSYFYNMTFLVLRNYFLLITSSWFQGIKSYNQKQVISSWADQILEQVTPKHIILFVTRCWLPQQYRKKHQHCWITWIFKFP